MIRSFPVSGSVPSVALAGMSAMMLAVGYGVMYGDFREEGAILMQMPWGIVTLVDVYVGLLLFSCWVVHRERYGFVAGGWITAFIVTGNLATCCYVLKAAAEARNEPGTFWSGRNRDA